jgi:hypothetical protein
MREGTGVVLAGRHGGGEVNNGGREVGLAAQTPGAFNGVRESIFG